VAPEPVATEPVAPPPTAPVPPVPPGPADAAPMAPPPAAPMGPGDPNRHFDGQQWLVWNGTAWVPEAPPAPPSSGGRRTLIVVVAIVVVALVAGGVFVASRVANAHKAIVIPSTLGGLNKATDPQVTAAADQFRKQAADALNGVATDVGAYGSAAEGQIALMVGARGNASADDFFQGVASGAGDIPPPTTVGNSHCVTVSSSSPIAVCMRSGGGLTVAVFVSGTDTSKASSMVDEAWDQQ
jgi:hypothetical protein